MNLPRYEFCKENRKILIEFLKIANEQKENKFNNKDEYEILKKLYPLQPDLKKQLDEYITNNSIVIELSSSSDEDDNKQERGEMDKDFFATRVLNTIDINHTVIEDITYAVKENLDTQKYLLPITINNLQSSSNLEDIFSALAEELNFEEVINFGKSLQNILPVNDNVVTLYIKYLLLRKINTEYSEDIRDILNNLAKVHLDVIEELSKYLLDSKDCISKVFLQLLEKLDKNVQIQLLRNCVRNCHSLQEIHISLFDTLLNNQIDFETLSKLIEILLSVREQYKTDKSFGKLIMNVIKLSGKNITLVEHPLEYIIASHKSIWKSKMQKVFRDSLEEASLMSQSFR